MTAIAVALLSLSVAPAGMSSEAKLGRIVVQVEGLESDAGTLEFALFNSKESFARKDRALQRGTVLIKGRQAIATFEALPLGDYAVIVAHDVNGDGNISRWPFSDELKGISNYDEKILWFPDWEKAKFALTQESRQLKIRVY